MPDPQHIAILFVVLNLIAFTLFGVDKMLSRSERDRLSEKTLLIAAGLGASPGAILAMVIFNHKTARPKFRFGIPLLLVAHAAFAYWINYN